MALLELVRLAASRRRAEIESPDGMSPSEFRSHATGIGPGFVPPAAIVGVPPDFFSDPNSYEMSSLWGRSATDLWGAGATVAHYDGQQWTLVLDTPAEARPGFVGQAVHVTGDAHSVWLSTPGPRFFRKLDVPTN